MSGLPETVDVSAKAFAGAVAERVRFERRAASAPVGTNVVALWPALAGRQDARRGGAVEVLFDDDDGLVRVRAPWTDDLAWPSVEGVRVTAADELRMRALAAGPGTLYRLGAGRAVSAPGALTFPIGPVRGDVMEAVGLTLTGMGDEVLGLRVDLGYKVRHVAAVAEGRDAEEAVRIVERATATSTVAHALAFSQAVEAAAGCETSERAALLRSVLAEVERVHSHLLDLAALANATGLPVAQQELMAARERVLRTAARLTGHRYLRGMIAPGGLLGDPGDAAWGQAVADVVAVGPTVARVIAQLDATPSFLDRLNAAGIVHPHEAEAAGAVGPVGRASAAGPDVRTHRPYAGYALRGPGQVPAARAGDAWARWRVRAGELGASVDWLRGAVLNGFGAGAARRPLPPVAEGAFGLGRAEGPRGEIVYAVVLEGGARLAEVRVRTASRRNWPLMPAAAARRNVLQDVPIIDASFALSAAGSDL